VIRAGAQLDSEFHNQFVEIEDEIGALEEQQVQHESGKKITRIRTAQAGQSKAAGEPVLDKTHGQGGTHVQRQRLAAVRVLMTWQT